MTRCGDRWALFSSEMKKGRVSRGDAEAQRGTRRKGLGMGERVLRPMAGCVSFFEGAPGVALVPRLSQLELQIC